MSKLFLVRNTGDSITFAVVSDGFVKDVQAFDAVKKHSDVGNFDYVDPKARRNYALERLGLLEAVQNNEPIPCIGVQTFSVNKNSVEEIPFDLSDVNGICNFVDFS